LNKFILHIILSLSFFATANAQQGENDLYDHRLNENKWDELREGIRYEGQKEGPGREWTYESKKDYEKAKRQFSEGGNGDGESGGGNGQGNGGSQNGGSSRQQPESSSDYEPSSPRSSPSLGGGLGVLGYILIALFIIALAFLIYYMFVNRQKDGAKVGKPIELEDINPAEIPLTELERLLKEALAKGDYRGAVRIYFIFIIRDLSEKRWITWQKEKTNLHYLREMSGKNEFDDFNRSVSYFEIIWYGKRELDATKFEQVRPNFTRFLEKLGVR